MRKPTSALITLQCRGRHRGYTLVEILVVLGIIAVLVALLIPAVQRVREVANRTQCANNLKQIGVAFQLHQDGLGFLPTAGDHYWTPPTYINGIPAVGHDQKAGWGFQILPYIESVNTWKGGDGVTDNERQRFAVGAVNPVFFCPTRRNPMTVTYFDGYISTAPDDKVTHALCDYASNNLNNESGVIRANGFGPPLRIADITDGTSTTLLASEKRMNLYHLGKPGRADDNEGYTAGNDWDTMRDTNHPPALDTRYPNSKRGYGVFGSSHPYGLNVIFADGAVRHVTFSIDPDVFSRLGTRADGRAVDISLFE